MRQFAINYTAQFVAQVACSDITADAELRQLFERGLALIEYLKNAADDGRRYVSKAIRGEPFVDCSAHTKRCLQLIAERRHLAQQRRPSHHGKPTLAQGSGRGLVDLFEQRSQLFRFVAPASLTVLRRLAPDRVF